MEKSQLIASLMGPTLIVLGITEAMNMHIFEHQTGPTIYLNGLIVFVAGLSLVRFHNIWELSWRVLITLTGWLLLAAGLYRMIFPEGQQAEATTSTFILLGVIIIVGLVLTVAAYGPKRK